MRSGAALGIALLALTGSLTACASEARSGGGDGVGERSRATAGTGSGSTGPTGEDTPLSEERVDDVTGVHTELGVEYATTPPMSGDHSQVPLVCDVYDEVVPDENAVHSLEHGAVWVTYDPDQVDEAGVEQLVDIALDGTDKLIVSPYEGLPAPVVVSAWNRQLRLTGPGDAGLDEFLAAYGDGHTSPEPQVSCDYGVGAGGQQVFPSA